MLSTILAQRPARSIEEVLGLMTAIEQALPAADGLRAFNHLYLRVTSAVRATVGTATVFHDHGFIDRLDVVFGNLISTPCPPATRTRRRAAGVAAAAARARRLARSTPSARPGRHERAHQP